MNIREKLKQIPVDKAFHFIGGWAFVATLFPYFPAISIIGLIVIAAWKEWDDAHEHGTSDYWDFIVTVAGGVCAALAHGFLGLF
jgi:hypothetical protein